MRAEASIGSESPWYDFAFYPLFYGHLAKMSHVKWGPVLPYTGG